MSEYVPTTEVSLVAISYKRDGKTYYLSMPSDHAEWAEQMLGLDLAAHDAEVAAKAKIEALDWAAEHLSDGQKYEDVAALNSWEAVTVCAGVIRARADEYRKAVQDE